MSSASRAILFTLLLLLCAPHVSAQLDRFSQTQARAGDRIVVELQVTDAVPGGRVVVSELLPVGATLVSWSVSGAAEDTEDLVLGRVDDALLWEFTAQDPDPTVSYIVQFPNQTGNATFEAVYAAAPAVFGRSGRTIPLARPSLIPTIPGIPKPDPLPVARGAAVPLASALFLLVLALVAGVLYVRARSVRRYHHDARWVGHSVHEMMLLNAISLKDRLADLFSAEGGALPIPDIATLDVAQERTFLEFPDRQARMIARLDNLERELPESDAVDRDMIERLKREIGSIQFNVEA